MRRISRYLAMLICISLLVGVSAASEHNSSENSIESSEHSFSFETVEASNTSEEFDYETDNGSINMEGVVQMPTPCHEIEADLSSSDDGEFSLEIDSVNNSTEESNSTDSGNETESESGEDICVQQIDYQGFEADFSASMPYEITVSFNEEEIETVAVDSSGVEVNDSNGNESEDELNETESSSEDSSVNETETEQNETENEANELNETSETGSGLNNETEESVENDSEDEPDVVIDSEPEDTTGDNESEINDSGLNSSETQNESVESEEDQNITDSAPAEDDGAGLQDRISAVVEFFSSLIPGR